jgi:phosphatidylserine/phosphatidylglycerophosphate/cardiolipin synthase-like enzyme
VAAQLQGKDLRDADKAENDPHELTDDAGNPSGDIQVWFSPNTTQKSVPRSKKGGTPKAPPTPPDLAEVFGRIENAKQGVLFLAFIPGNPSIVSKLKETYNAKRKQKQLFYLRGAATSPEPASLFRVDLYHRSGISDTTVRAVIHDKILVIDPFTDDSVVVTGSHNLGFKASYANDENMVIIRKDRQVAAAYAAHVLDVYEHYRWRWKLQEPIRDAFQKLKEANPKSKSADLWRLAMEEVGPRSSKRPGRSRCPTIPGKTSM